jgi:PAS domain S-box-containing protein
VLELQERTEELESQRQRYSDLFEFAPHAYVVTDPCGTILEANLESVELLHWSSAELRGMAIESLIPMEQRLVFRGNFISVIGAGGTGRKSWHGAIEGKKGRLVGVEFSVRRIMRQNVTHLCWQLRPAT